MSSMSECQKNDRKLGQYYNLLHYDSWIDGHAKRIFLEEFNIDYQRPPTKYQTLIGCTALHLAAERNRLYDIDFLLSRGANFMIKNQIRCTPLHLAIKESCRTFGNWQRSKSCCKSLLSAQVKSGTIENPKDGNGLSHFHIACMVDHAESIELFLKNGISVDETTNMDSKSFPGYTPLHLAAKYSALQAIKLLLSYGANTQLKNAKEMSFMYTLLKARMDSIQWYATRDRNFNDPIEHDNLQILNLLLQNDAHPIEYAGLTHFHIACSGTELSIAERFLQEVTDINQTVDLDAARWSGYTALHFAAYSSIEMVKMLVKNEANFLAKNGIGETPFDICMRKYGVKDVHDVLSLEDSWRSILMSDRKTRLLSLIFTMTDTNQFDNFLEAREQIVNTFVPLDSPVWQGFTPLHVAVKLYAAYQKDERSKHIFERLIAKGANINAQDIHGRSPIHLAFRQRWGMSHHNATIDLLKFNDKIEEVIDEDNLSHLLIACDEYDINLVMNILQANTSVDVNVAYKGQTNLHRIRVGSTPLHRAAYSNAIVNLLLQRGGNPYLKDSKGMTAIHHTVGSEDSVLLSLPDLKDSIAEDSGLSHLHIASYAGNVTAATKLLDQGVNVNQPLLRTDVFEGIGDYPPNSVGDIPLDFAIVSETATEMLNLLLRRGAEILLKESDVVDRDTSDILKPVVSPLDRDDDLFKRLEKEIGLTMLHVACSRRDVDLVRTLLASGADVNARIHERSRIWPGYTALHVIMDDNDHNRNLDDIVQLLLDNGSDVTLSTCAPRETALFLAYEKTILTSQSNQYSRMKMILKTHKDFIVDPTSDHGLSCFYVACSIGDIVAVKEFLKHNADVNQIFFPSVEYYRNVNGCTPLHLAAAVNEHAVDSMTQLKLVDLLLNYGADVDAEDLRGDTALHYMVRWNSKREDVIMRLVRSKANMNSRNVRDETPLEVLMTTNKDTTVEHINCYLKFGCFFNVFNSITDKGLIGMALALISYTDLVKLIRILMINFPNLMQVDDVGRTVIHNIVSCTNQPGKQQPAISESQYVKLIEELDEFGFCIDTRDKLRKKEKYVKLIEELDEFGFCIDTQDKLGRTPLHLAVLFRNTEAISGLLMAGADINLTDLNGKTAFSYIFESCSRCSTMDHYNSRKNHSQYDHLEMFSIFVKHMKKLLYCGLDVNQVNEKLMFVAFEKCKSEDMSIPELFKDQINEIRNLKIAESKLTLGNFLSETDAIVAYPTLPKAERDAVDAFFKNEISHLRTKYSQVASIFRLQYRKAVDRIELIEPALSALNDLERLSFPDLCSTAILKLLTNLELSSFIEATKYLKQRFLYVLDWKIDVAH